MHHLVQQRVDGFGPAIAAHVPARDDDLAQSTVVRARRVMPKPPREPARDLNLEMVERATEMLAVELRVKGRQPRRHRQIVRMLRCRTSRRGPDRDGVLDDDVTRRRSFRTIAGRREGCDRGLHMQRRVHKTFVHAKHAA